MFNLPLWRDISIVLLALEVMIGLAPVLILGYLGVTYFARGIDWLQNTLRKVRRETGRVQHSTLKIGRTIISPIIAIRQAIAFGKGMIRGAITVLRGK